MTLAQPLKDKANAVFLKKSAATRTIRKRIKSGLATAFLGALVTITGETGPDIDLCAVDEPIFGIITGHAQDADNLDYDADGPFAALTWVMVTIPVPGDVFLLCAPTNIAITLGAGLEPSAGFAIDDAGDGATPNASFAGIALEAVSAVASTETYFWAMKT